MKIRRLTYQVRVEEYDWHPKRKAWVRDGEPVAQGEVYIDCRSFKTARQARRAVIGICRLLKPKSVTLTRLQRVGNFEKGRSKGVKMRECIFDRAQGVEE